MERVVHVSRAHDEARRWDIVQQQRATPEERQAAARELKRRAYGDSPPDLRESERPRRSGRSD